MKTLENGSYQTSGLKLNKREQTNNGDRVDVGSVQSVNPTKLNTSHNEYISPYGWMSIRSASKMLDISEKTIRYQIDTKKFPFEVKKIGKQYRVKIPNDDGNGNSSLSNIVQLSNEDKMEIADITANLVVKKLGRALA